MTTGTAAATLSLGIRTGEALAELKALTDGLRLFKSSLQEFNQSKAQNPIRGVAQSASEELQQFKVRIAELESANQKLSQSLIDQAKKAADGTSTQLTRIYMKHREVADQVSKLDYRFDNKPLEKRLSILREIQALSAAGTSTGNLISVYGREAVNGLGQLGRLEGLSQLKSQLSEGSALWKSEMASRAAQKKAQLAAEDAAYAELNAKRRAAEVGQAALQTLNHQKRAAELAAEDAAYAELNAKRKTAEVGQAALQTLNHQKKMAELAAEDAAYASINASRKAATAGQVALEQQRARATKEAADTAAARAAAERTMYLDIQARRDRDRDLNAKFEAASPSSRLRMARWAASFGDGAEGRVGTAAAAFGNAQGIAQLEAAVASLSRSQKGAGEATKTHTDQVQRLNAAMRDGHSAARGFAGAFGATWMTWGNVVPLVAFAALGTALREAVKQGAELERQLTFVKALGDGTTGDVSNLRQQVFKQAGDGLYSPVELANGLRMLSQAGLSTSESMFALSKATDLATVGEMSMKDASLALVGVMNAFRVPIDNVSHVGDVFAKAAAVSQTSVEQMTQAMKTASVVGEMYGASMEDTATALTLLAKVNITGTAAGTSFRNMLKEIYTPGNQAKETMKQLGLSAVSANGNVKSFADVLYDLRGKLEHYTQSSQMNILQHLFGERGAKEAVAMLSLTRTKWDELQQQIAKSDGFAARVTAELSQTTSGAMTQAINTLQVSFVKAFESTEGGVKQLALKMKELFGSPEFVNGITNIVSGLVKLTAVITDLAVLLPSAIAAWAAWKVGMIAVGGAATTAAAGVTGLRAALLLVSTHPLVAALTVAAAAASYFWLKSGGPEAETAAQAAKKHTDAITQALKSEAEAAEKAYDEHVKLQAARSVGKTTTELALDDLKGQRDAARRALSDADADVAAAQADKTGAKTPWEYFKSVNAAEQARRRASENLRSLEEAVKQGEENAARASNARLMLGDAQNAALLTRMREEEKEKNKLRTGSKTFTANKPDRGLVSAEKAAVVEEFNHREKMAKQVYDSEIRVSKQLLNDKLIFEYEFYDQRAEAERKYLEAVTAEQERAQEAISQSKNSAERKSQQLALDTAAKKMRDHIEEQKQLDDINKAETARHVTIRAQAEAKEAVTKTIPALVSKSELENAKALEEIYKDLMNVSDQAALAARVRVRQEFGPMVSARQTLIETIEKEIEATKAQLEAQRGLDGEYEYSSTRAANLSRTLEGLLAKLKAELSVLSALDAAQKQAGNRAETVARQVVAASQTAQFGMASAMAEYEKGALNSAASVKSAWLNAFKGIEDALVNLVKTGKLDFKSLVDSITSDLIRIAVKENITGPLAGMLKLAGSSSKSNLPIGGGGLYDAFAMSSAGQSLGLSSAYIDVLGIGEAGATGLTTAGAGIGAALPWVGGGLALASAMGLFGGDGDAMRTGRYVSPFAASNSLGDPTQGNMPDGTRYNYLNNQWFSADMAAAQDAFDAELQDTELKLAQKLGLQAKDWAAINAQLSAIDSKRYNFGMEHTDVNASGVFDQIRADRMQAISSGLGMTLQDLTDIMSGAKKSAYELAVETKKLTAEQAKAKAGEMLTSIGGTMSALDSVTGLRSRLMSSMAGIRGANTYANRMAGLQSLLADERDISRQIDLADQMRNLIMDRYDEEKSAIEENKRAALEAQEELRRSLRAVGSYARDLLVGDLATGTSGQQLETARSQFADVLAKAQAGDLGALSEVTGKATTYLEKARGYYASSDSYVGIFSGVQSTLAALGVSAESVTDTTDWQAKLLAVDSEALASLNSIEVTTEGWTQTLENLLVEQIRQFEALGVSLSDIGDNTQNLDKRIAVLIDTALAVRFDKLSTAVEKSAATTARAVTGAVQVALRA